MKEKGNSTTKRPLLSICIPTYNRANILRQSLESYVNNDVFDDEIELIISDNASTDNTYEVGNYYSKRYNNIKYFRNENNIHDRNFPLSLDHASGCYLKLMKDTLKISENGLRYLKEGVKAHIIDRNPVFFTNGILYNSLKKNECVCDSFSSFLIHVSYYVTAIHIVGCWKEDWQSIKDKEKYSHLQLAQDDWMYQIVKNRGNAVLYTKKYFSMFDLGKKEKSGYNWFEVHVSNYYKILDPYVESLSIPSNIVRKERSTYLRGLMPQLTITFIYNYSPSWNFDTKGASSILWNHFKRIPMLYILLFSFPIWGLYTIMKNELRLFLIKMHCWDYVKRVIGI